MAGETTVAQLDASLNSIIASARSVRENALGFTATVRKEMLEEGTGVAWQEVVIGRLNTQPVGETQRLDNPQAFVDTLFQIEPTAIGIHIVITPKVQTQISKKVLAQLGGLMQNAIQRQKDVDGFALYDTATFSQPGAGATLQASVLAALSAQILGNATEGVDESEPLHCWLNPFQMYDLMAELASPLGAYLIQPGASEDAIRQGLKGVGTMLGGAQLHQTANIRVDSSDDGHGGLHAQRGIVLVEWDFPKVFNDVLKNMMGAAAYWQYDGFAYGQISNGTMFGRILSDALAPAN